MCRNFCLKNIFPPKWNFEMSNHFNFLEISVSCFHRNFDDRAVMGVRPPLENVKKYSQKNRKKTFCQKSQGWKSAKFWTLSWAVYLRPLGLVYISMCLRPLGAAPSDLLYLHRNAWKFNVTLFQQNFYPLRYVIFERSPIYSFAKSRQNGRKITTTSSEQHK